MKSAPELFEAGWHAHKTDNGHVVFIDESLYPAYIERFPGGPIQQLIEASEQDPNLDKA